MRRSAPIVLLTDFGTRDHYAATVKGVLLGLAPGSPVVDLSHEVGPYAVDEAAYLLWSSHRWFPRDTVFVAVVDPGVGTARRIVCLRTRAHTFLAPDNGVLKFVAGDHPRAAAYAVDTARLTLGTPSDTFHGRDIFAPVAARLARGARPSSLGPRMTLKRETMIDLGRERLKRTQGRIVAVDRFGNIVTNLLVPPGGGWKARVARRSIRQWAVSYGSSPAGGPFLIRGSSGLLEISMNRRSAARVLRARIGQKVEVWKIS